jgi:hypothetical protein
LRIIYADGLNDLYMAARLDNQRLLVIRSRVGVATGL